MYEELYDIPMYSNWKGIRKIDEGWSKDLKFYIQDKDGQELLLRLSDAKCYEAKCAEFKMVKKINTLDFSMSKALAMGKCNNEQSVYMMLTWVRGKSLDKEITKLTEEEQYTLGIEAGKILKQIHSLTIESDCLDRLDSKKELMFEKLKCYEASKYRVEKDKIALEFMRKNIDCIEVAKPAYKHGDFHIGNLILTPDQHIGVIDFNRWRCGDPYEEFYKVQSFDREVSVPFSRGKIDGYFEGNPTEAFWCALAVYNAYASLHSIAWAIPFGEEEVKGMITRCERAFEDYDDFERMIPRWYQK